MHRIPLLFPFVCSVSFSSLVRRFLVAFFLIDLIEALEAPRLRPLLDFGGDRMMAVEFDLVCVIVDGAAASVE